MKKLIYILVVTVSLCHHVSAANAQSTTLSISPPVIEVLISPGTEVVQTFKIKAEGRDISIIPNLHLIKPSGEDGHVEVDLNPINPASIPLVIKSSHTMGAPHPIISQNGEIEITLSIEAASTDISQDVYLALVITIEQPGLTPESRSSLTTPGISSLILTTISPTGVMPINLEIGTFDTPLIHDTWQDFSITPSLKNAAPIMIRPEGTFKVISASGKTIHSTLLYPNLILGNSARYLKASSPASSLEDFGDPIDIVFSPSWTNIGPHRIIVTINTQGGSKLTEVERTVWFLPIRLTIISISLTLIALALYLQRHKKLSFPIDTSPPTN